MFQLMMVIQALALEVKTDGKMMATSRAKGDPYKIAQRNGWTFQTGKGTKAARRACLIDVIALRLANDPSYVVGDYVTEALGPDDTQKARDLAAEWVEQGLFS